MKLPSVRVAAPGLVLLALLVSCCSPFSPDSGDGHLIIMSWNVNSLFDAVDDGNEYSGFSMERGDWSEAKYRARLSALASVVLRAGEAFGESAGRTPGPDVLCLVEIEKKSVLDELAKGPLARCGYRWSAFAKAEDSPIGVGVLSRMPIEEARAWGLDLGKGRERPILETRFSIGGKPLAVFVNHWKSKMEGDRVTEGSRIASARLLASTVATERASVPGLAVVACGDFNENPDESRRAGARYATALGRSGDPGAPPVFFVGRKTLTAQIGEEGMPTDPSNSSFLAFSPWDDVDGYSYVHKGMRERIDGFVLSPELLDGAGLEYSGFATMDRGLVDDKGAPIPWSNSRASGWSDHLPILLELGT